MKPYEITRENFEQQVVNSDRPVLLDFFAPWCGPCRMVAPVLDEIAREHPEIKVCKVNVDEQPELAARYGIVSIPTLFVLRDGQVVNQAKGAQTKTKLLAML